MLGEVVCSTISPYLSILADKNAKLCIVDKIQTHKRLKRVLFIRLFWCSVFRSTGHQNNKRGLPQQFACCFAILNSILFNIQFVLILFQIFFHSVAGHSMVFSDGLMPFMTEDCYCANCYTVVATSSLCMSSSLDLSQAFCWKFTRICL